MSEEPINGKKEWLMTKALQYPIHNIRIGDGVYSIEEKRPIATMDLPQV